MLNDGTLVKIRPILPDDASLLQDFFYKLSPDSIYLRFLKSIDELTDDQAHYFANVDYLNRMALVGLTNENDLQAIIGVARYDLVQGETEVTGEAAIIIRDDHHNQGLGTMIMLKLVKYAKAQGVKRMVATVHIGNRGVINFIKRSGLAYQKMMIDSSSWEIQVDLTQNPAIY